MDDRKIDAAIESFPLEDLPKGFVKRTMKRLSLTPETMPDFRLRFIDFAIPVFFAGFLLAVVAFGSWAFSLIDPLWFDDLGLELAYLRLTFSPQIRLVIQGGVVVILVIVTLIIGFAFQYFVRPKKVRKLT
jgi:hypothetical protein